MATITDDDLKMFQERAKTEFASRCDTGGIAWDSVIWDLCNEVRKLRSVSKEHGDCAKLREALVSVQKKIHYLIGSLNVPNSLVANRMEINGIINAALAAPPRNCDVCTVKELNVRYNKFCYAHRSPENGCGGCPLNGEPCCELAWAQMPYKEGGAK